ncbi:MAG: pimeloyl-ACP methyl ester carboxylesterase [Bradymonadia bacterium]|jgi:pimeloyl-ACP methyl ester carboxylesterase
MSTERITFTSDDGHELSGRLERPDGEVRASAIFAHCFTCSKDSKAAVRVSRALAERGFLVLRFDFTGLGASEGTFDETTFTSNVSDVVKAADFLAERGCAPCLLVGHSLGGAAVLRATRQISSVRGVCTIGAPSRPSHVTAQFEEHLDDIRRAGDALVELAGRPFTIREEFVADLAKHDRIDVERGVAALIFHAPDDDVVPVYNAKAIYDALSHPKSFLSLPGADHLLQSGEDADYVAHIVAIWARRYFL